MCKGPIVAPAGKKAIEKQNSLKETFKKFLQKITGRGYFVLLNQSLVHACLKCGDLKINNEWQRIPYPYTTSIKNAMMTGGILVNGHFTVCDFCVSVEKQKEEERICSAFGPISSLSF